MKRIMLIVISLLLLCAALSGCAKQDAAPQIAGLQTTAAEPVALTGDEELEYCGVFGTAPDTIHTVSGVQASDGRYWQTGSRREGGSYIYYLCSFSVEGGFFQRHPYAFPKDCSALIWSPVPGKTDTLWIVETAWNSDIREYDSAHLKLVDADGKVLADKDVTNIDFNQDGYSHPYLLADERGVWLWAYDILYRFDENGERIFSVPLEKGYNEPSLALMSAGQLAALIYDASGAAVRVLNEETKTFGDPIKVSGKNAAPGDDFYDLYVWDKMLCGLDLETGTETKILRLADVDLDENRLEILTPYGVSDTGAPQFACYEGFGSTPTPCVIKQVPAGLKKTVLTMGVLYMPYDLRQQIIQFNRKNLDYRIDYIEYQDINNTNGRDAAAFALTTGQIPDLIDLYGLPADSYVEKGLLEDLSPYMKDDAKVNPGNILPQLLPALEKDGAFYGLTPSFRLTTAVTLKSQAGDTTGWDYPDVLRILDAHPQMTQPVARMSRQYGGERFVEIEAAKHIGKDDCTFDSEAFAAYLEFCRRIPDRTYPEDVESEEYLDDGEALMQLWSDFFSLRMFLDLREIFGEDLQVSGIPGIGSIVSLDHQIAMTTKCAEKDTAWSFIRQYVLSVDGSQAAFEIPVLADEYQEFLSYTRQNYTENYENGVINNGKLVYLPTDADFAAWDALMQDIVRMPRYEEGVYDIIREEVTAFLEGNTSAQDAARVIQSRVKIAVAEGK